MIRLGTVVMGAADVERAVGFWAEALGYRPHAFPDSANNFTLLIPPGGDGTRIALQHSMIPAGETPSVHMDFVVDTAVEQVAEVERLVRLGASRVDWDGYPDDPDFIVLADTEGNRFCIVNAGHA